jgi:hypothetical protein
MRPILAHGPQRRSEDPVDEARRLGGASGAIRASAQPVAWRSMRTSSSGWWSEAAWASARLNGAVPGSKSSSRGRLVSSLW